MAQLTNNTTTMAAMKVQGGRMVPAGLQMSPAQRQAAQKAYSALEKVVPHTRSLWADFQAAGLTRQAGEMNRAHEIVRKLFLELDNLLKNTR